MKTKLEDKNRQILNMNRVLYVLGYQPASQAGGEQNSKA